MSAAQSLSSQNLRASSTPSSSNLRQSPETVYVKKKLFADSPSPNSPATLSSRISSENLSPSPTNAPQEAAVNLQPDEPCSNPNSKASSPSKFSKEHLDAARSEGFYTELTEEQLNCVLLGTVDDPDDNPSAWVAKYCKYRHEIKENIVNEARPQKAENSLAEKARDLSLHKVIGLVIFVVSTTFAYLATGMINNPSPTSRQ